VNKHTLNRVKKNINDFIMKNYTTLFANRASGSSNAQAESAAFVVAGEDILSCTKILWKAKDELRNSMEPNKEPAALINECIQELCEKGFLLR